MIAKADQHALPHRDTVDPFLGDVESLGLRDFQKLLKERPDLSHTLHMDAEPPAGVGVVARLVGIAPSPHQQEEVGLALLAEEFLARLCRALVHVAQEKVPALRQRCHQRHGAHAAVVLRGEEHPGVARMHRKAEHPATQFGDGLKWSRTDPGAVIHPRRGRRGSNRPQVLQQSLGAFERLGLGFLEPRKVDDVVNARGLERQHHLGQVEALDLGQFLQRTLRVLAFGPEPHRDPRRRAAGAAGPLVGRGHGDLLDEEGVDAPVRVKARHAGEAAIHDHGDAVDGQRGLSDIGRHDDFAAVVAGHGAVLLLGWQLAVQRKADEATQGMRALHILHRAADLKRSGHEHEDVALGLRGQPLALARSDGPDRVVLEVHGLGQVFNLHGKGAALRREHVARGEIILEQRRIQRGRHDDQLQIGARRLLDLQGAGQGDVTVKVALVEFVEDDGTDAAQVRVE